MNIFDVLKLIRDSNGKEGEYTRVAEAIMDLYLTRAITCRTLLRVYAEIIHILILDASPYGHEIQHPQKSQGV